MHAKNNFERTGVELTIAYVAFPEGALSLTPYAGIQYTDHKWSFKSSSEKVDIDDSWVDGVIGLKLAYMINQEWTRNNQLSCRRLGRLLRHPNGSLLAVD